VIGTARANLRHAARKLPKKKLDKMTNSRWPQQQLGQREHQAGPTAVWKAVFLDWNCFEGCRPGCQVGLQILIRTHAARQNISLEGVLAADAIKTGCASKALRKSRVLQRRGQPAVLQSTDELSGWQPHIHLQRRHPAAGCRMKLCLRYSSTMLDLNYFVFDSHSP